MSLDSTKFGTRFRELREQAGWTQKELGQATGLDHSTFSHYESGRMFPSVTRLHAIAETLGVEIADFFEGVTE